MDSESDKPPRADQAMALEGLRVLDIATYIAAPFCAELLGEFGAEVIKVEMPGAGDPLRVLGKQVDGVSLWWLSEARNKKSVTCDMRTPAGQDLVRRLARVSDIVVENFRPGTLERWNLGYEELARVNPGLIMVRISGYGQTGPYSPRPAFGRIAAAFSGMAYISGYPDRPPVSPGTPTVPDYSAGVFGALGALIAKADRDRTGRGQVVDVGLFEPMLKMLDELIPVYDRFGYVRERIGSGAESAVPHNHYRAGDGKWLAIACTNQRMFERLAEAMERPGLLADPRFATVPDRLAHREAMDGIVQAWASQRPRHELMEALEKAEVPNGPVNSVEDLVADRHIRARGDILEATQADGSGLKVAGIVPKLSRTPGRLDWLGPRTPGAHNAEVYGGLLGMSQAELDGLQAQGVI
jgi:crotonobetainyl-CoA:carnitine CoA-transferase CaiB-like acyl-CoA transferase